MMPQTCFLVVGTPRSGTSCVCGILHHLGIQVVNSPASPSIRYANPKGFFEDEDVMRLLTVGMPITLESKTSLVTRHQWALIKRECRRQLQRVFAARCESGKSWACKVILFGGIGLAEIIAAIPCEVLIIHTDRPVADSTASAETAFGSGADIADIHARTKVALSVVTVPILTVDFRSLTESPRVDVGRIAEFCQMPVTQSAVEFIDPSLRHF